MITIISGTNRPDNNSQRIARICQRSLKDRGVTAPILSMEELPPDFLSSEMYGERGKEMDKLLEELVVPADKFLFIVPEYNGSISGVLKVFLDSVDPRVFHHKKASLIGVSAGFNGNLRGLDHLTSILHYLQMETLPFKTKIPFIYEKLGGDDELADPDRKQDLSYQMDRFIEF
ncbi:MAG: NADPH-dependent FMN reductase [Flavobacteriales bacterium]